MNTISKTHKRFSESLNNPRVLENPEEFLGAYTQDILDFWLIIDQLTEEQWGVIKERYKNQILEECRNESHKSPKKRTFYRCELFLIKHFKITNNKETNARKIITALLEICTGETLWATFELIGGPQPLKELTFIPMFLNL